MDRADFDHRMAVMGPFETKPQIAVAVSGGADSMALALLADCWARDRGGRVIALTVDHGLRSGAAEEAGQVGRWLAERGIEHRTLTWTGDKPDTGVQAVAREARYRLMAKTCRNSGILHLLIAHHLEDQAETFLLRLGRSSGIDGLAAMSAVFETDGIRLLRPLLQVPRERLRSFLGDQGQDWIEDPSNENRAYARVRIRQSLPELAAAGVSAAALVETSMRMAHVRVALEATASTLLGRAAFVHPMGYVDLDGQTLFDAPEEISRRALSRALMCVGGGIYAPATKKLEALHEKMKAQLCDLKSWKGATLGRCRVVFGSAGRFRIMREMRHLPAREAVPAGGQVYWDHRFDLRFGVRESDRGEAGLRFVHNDLAIAPLGVAGLAEIRSAGGCEAMGDIPSAVLWSLPAMFVDQNVTAVPHLDYINRAPVGTVTSFDRAVFFPRQSLSGAGFAIAE